MFRPLSPFYRASIKSLLQLVLRSSARPPFLSVTRRLAPPRLSIRTSSARLSRHVTSTAGGIVFKLLICESL